MRLKKDKSGDTVGRPSWRSSLPGDPGAKFICGKPQHMKNSLNFANTCLKVVDTCRRGPTMLDIFRAGPKGVPWLGTAEDIAEARATVKRLYALSPGKYFT